MTRSAHGRDLAIDALRGLAIWSMVSLHFADGTWAAEPTHLFPYMDGMSAFVLLSGLVLGIVHQRWISRFSLRYSVDRLIRRIAVLYVCQAAIGLAAVLAAAAFTRREFRRVSLLPYPDDVGEKVRWALGLRYLPSGGNILLLYLILMVLALAVIPILMRGWWPLVIAGSIGLYVVSQTSTAGWMVVTSFPGGLEVQNWAAWQILFMIALVIGWHWDRLRVPERVDTALPVLVTVALAVGFTVRDVIRSRSVVRHSGWLIDKVDLGVVRVIVAFLVVTTLYGVFRAVLGWTRRDVLRPLVSTGARSLDSYVIQALALLAVPAVLVPRPWSASTAMTTAVVVFATCWLWAETRSRFRIDKLHRLPARVVQAGAAGIQRAGRTQR